MTVQEVTVRRAEELCAELGMAFADRDMVVRTAYVSGVNIKRISDLTGLARATVSRIVNRPEAGDG